MKKYIQPAMAIYNLNISSVLTSTSFELSEETVDGSSALTKRHNHNDAWDNNDDWDEDDEDF